MQKIILDLSTFKALAGETRVAILKQLQERKHMQTELASELNLAVPTVKEHLNALEKAGLVAMIDEGRKWKYYELTQKGRAILEPEQEKTTLLVLLGVWIAAVVGGVGMWLKNRLPSLNSADVVPQLMTEFAKNSQAIPAPEQQLLITSTINPWIVVYAVVVGVLTIGIIWLLFMRVKK